MLVEAQRWSSIIFLKDGNTGRVVTTSYDIAQRPGTVKGTSTAGTVTPYVGQSGYYPQGAVSYWQYGNNVWPAANYTKNLQPLAAYSTINNSSNSFLLSTRDNWSPNGLVGSAQDCYGPAGTAASLTCMMASYTYDQFDRLTGVTDKNGSTTNYYQNFQYDEYGNQVFSADVGRPLSGVSPTASQSPFNSKNQLISATHNARGDVTVLGAVSMSYDAENHETQTVDSGTSQTLSYLYDAQDQRAQKQVAGGATNRSSRISDKDKYGCHSRRVSLGDRDD